MSEPFQIYMCSVCSEVAIVNGEKRDAVFVHGKSPGGTTRCGGLLVHVESRGGPASPRQSDGHEKGNGT